jgi:hypothetical protein
MNRSLAYFSIGLLLFSLLTGCRASRILFPEIYGGDTNWLKAESSHYFIYYRPDSPASHDIGNIAKSLDSCFEDVIVQLGVDFSGKISYYLYNSTDDLEHWAGWHRWGFFVGDFQSAVQVYDSVRTRINAHETVHVIVYQTVGIFKLGFLNEGIAEAIAHYYERWPSGNLTLHKNCKLLLYEEKLFPLDVLADNDRFKEIYLSPESGNYYNQCGSFVRYLIDQYGLDKFKFLLPRAGEDNYKEIFQELYGQSIDEFEKEWRHFLSIY